MANTIRIKRSAVQGKVPAVGDLSLGELALNTYDGKLYTLKNDGTNSVIEIGANTGGNFSADISLQNQSSTRYYESSANGNNYIAVRAPSTLTTDVTLTLPANDGDPDQVLGTDGNGNLSWVSRVSGTGTTGDFLVSSTASEQSGYFGNIFLKDDSNTSHYLEITNSADLTALRTLSINVNDDNRTISLSGNLTVSSAATISGTNTGDQTITLTGDVTGSGTGSFVATLANSGVSAGTYRSVTVNAKGLVTGGTNPTTLSGYGITDALSNSTTSTQSGYFGDIFLYDDSTPSHYLAITNSANLTAARTLSINVNNADRTVSLSGNLTVSSAATISGTNTGDQTITLTGDVTGSGTGSFAATLANSGVTAGTYRSVTVDEKGRVTAGTNPTTLSGYGITDALSNSTTSTQTGYFGNIALYDDSTPSHYLTVTNSANLTAARTLSINVNDADRTISLSGNLTVSAAATVSGTNTGDQTITLTGDVTGSGTDSFATTIADDAVTFAKMQNSAAGLSVVGRSTNSAGDFAEISAANDGEVLRRSGTTLGFGTITLESIPDAWVKRTVKAATTADLGAASSTTTTLTGTLVVFPAQDGISFAVGDRLLVKNQTAASQNGIYTLTTAGVASTTAWVLTRSADADTSAELAGATVSVDQGTTQGGFIYDTNFKTTDTIGTTACNFSRILDTGAVSGDATVANSGALTIANNAVTFAKIQNSAAAGMSVVGRSANSAGVFAEISAGTNGHVLRRSGTAIGFGEIATAGIANSAVTFAKIQNSAAAGLSVIGRSANSAGVFAEIAAGTDGHVLYRASSTSLTFGQLPTASIANSAITYAKIQDVSATDRLLGRSTAGAGVVEEITCTAAGRALLDDADAAAQRATLGLGTIATQAANSVSITGGSVTGITDITLADGGTNASLTAVNGGVVWSNATQLQITAAGSSGQFLKSAGANAPTWATLEMTDIPGAVYKKSVKAATTANLGTVTYANGTAGVGATITGPTGASAVVFPAQDGVTISVGDRILVKNQTTAAQNGIYTLTTAGVAGTTAWVLTRATDADTNTEIGAAVVAVDQGTANGGEVWTTNFKSTDTVGTTAMTWNEILYNNFISPSFTTDIVTSSASFNVFNTNATTINAFGAATALTLGSTSGSTTVRNNLTVTGNLTINGTTTTVNSTVTTLDDPIVTLGGDTSVAETTKDRGIEFKWGGTSITLNSIICNDTGSLLVNVSSTSGYATGDIITISGATGAEQQKLNGTWAITVVNLAQFTIDISPQTIPTGTLSTNLGTAVRSKNGFFGLDQSTGRFTFIPQANNVSEVFSGTLGEIESGGFRSGDDTFARYGASADLLIGHVVNAAGFDYTSSAFITNNTGSLNIEAASGDVVRIKGPTGTGTIARFVAGGAAELYHNGTKIFETASTGATLTGDLTVTGGDIFSAAGTASTLFSTTTTGNVSLANGLTSGTLRIGSANGSGQVDIGNTGTAAAQTVNIATATTGTITIGGTGATAVQLPTGKTKIGTSTLAQGSAFTYSLPTAAANATLAITANKLNVFAATTSAELAGVISNVTGSGSLVFATSPTLVTPTLGNATSTTLTVGNRALTSSYNCWSETGSGAMGIFGHNARSGAANNTVVANVSSWHGHFIRMYYSDGIAVHTTTGTVTAGDVLYDQSTPANQVASAGERVRIRPDGNVGIGVTAPSFKADIAGDVRVTSTNKMRFGGTAGTTNFYIQYNSTTNSLDFVAG